MLIQLIFSIKTFNFTQNQKITYFKNHVPIIFLKKLFNFTLKQKSFIQNQKSFFFAKIYSHHFPFKNIIFTQNQKNFRFLKRIAFYHFSIIPLRKKFFSKTSNPYKFFYLKFQFLKIILHKNSFFSKPSTFPPIPSLQIYLFYTKNQKMI